MTTTEATPAEIIRYAVTHLRTVTEAAPGEGSWFLDHDEAERQEENADDPWFMREYADSDEWRVGCWGPDFGGGAHMTGFYVKDECTLNFARYVATMGPQVAGPLATLLEAIAVNAETRGGQPQAEVLNLAKALIP